MRDVLLTPGTACVRETRDTRTGQWSALVLRRVVSTGRPEAPQLQARYCTALKFTELPGPNGASQDNTPFLHT